MQSAFALLIAAFLMTGGIYFVGMIDNGKRQTLIDELVRFDNQLNLVSSDSLSSCSETASLISCGSSLGIFDSNADLANSQLNVSFYGPLAIGSIPSVSSSTGEPQFTLSFPVSASPSLCKAVQTNLYTKGVILNPFETGSSSCQPLIFQSTLP